MVNGFIFLCQLSMSRAPLILGVGFIFFAFVLSSQFYRRASSFSFSVLKLSYSFISFKHLCVQWSMGDNYWLILERDKCKIIDFDN